MRGFQISFISPKLQKETDFIKWRITLLSSLKLQQINTLKKRFPLLGNRFC